MKIIGPAIFSIIVSSSFPGLAQSELDAANHYTTNSVSMTAGSGLAVMLSEPNAASTLDGFNVNFRFITHGVVVSPTLSIGANDGMDSILVPGFNLGYAIPVANVVAVTPMLRTAYLIDMDNEMYNTFSFSGGVGVEFFLGKNGFLEPVFTVGAIFPPNTNAIPVIGMGYNLGVVF